MQKTTAAPCYHQPGLYDWRTGATSDSQLAIIGISAISGGGPGAGGLCIVAWREDKEIARLSPTGWLLAVTVFIPLKVPNVTAMSLAFVPPLATSQSRGEAGPSGGEWSDLSVANAPGRCRRPANRDRRWSPRPLLLGNVICSLRSFQVNARWKSSYKVIPMLSGTNSSVPPTPKVTTVGTIASRKGLK